MSSLIKNQIIKHLSKFAKNLSPDKIQISTLKGEGELTNLQLNEDILMELMDLPTWLKLTRADCNKVHIKILWSKLKSQPVRLYLDEVTVLMEMCEELRKPFSESDLPSYSSGGSYSFGDRVVDGMFLQINSINIEFTSKAFNANLNISRVVVQSMTPTWRTASDLQHTRISEKQNDLLLTFKQIDWQTLRVEADCLYDSTGAGRTTPLRLITNQSKIRISVKKRYSDCSVVATKVQFLMDDLLWILTDSQMKAAVIFARHLKHKMDQASEQSKRIAARTLRRQQQASTSVRSQTGNSSSSAAANQSPNSSLFLRFDIIESSYHIQTGRIDLHICDDVNEGNTNRGVYGGAVGVAVMRLSVSHYPSRTIGQTRKSKYTGDIENKEEWTHELFRRYEEQLNIEKKIGSIPSDVDIRTAASGLVERLSVLTVEDFYITTVSMDDDKGNRPKKLLRSDKKALFLPSEMPAFHLEHTEYFFSHESQLPTPYPNMYIKLNPVKLTVDVLTITWFTSFAMSLAKDVEKLIAELPDDDDSPTVRIELRLEALMPKIVIPVTETVPLPQDDRPDSINIIISKVLLTNNQWAVPSKSLSIESYTSVINSYKNLRLLKPDFPCYPDDLSPLSNKHEDYCSHSRVSYLRYENQDETTSSVMKSSMDEVMSVELEQFWMEFSGVKNSGCRPVSFVESFPITLWVSLPDINPTDNAEKQLIQPGISVLVNIGAKICAQLNHYQFLFLMRLVDSLTEMSDTIEDEIRRHEDELTETLGTAGSSATVLLSVREVQFALLANPTTKPDMTQKKSSYEDVSLPLEIPAAPDSSLREMEIKEVDSGAQSLSSLSSSINEPVPDKKLNRQNSNSSFVDFTVRSQTKIRYQDGNSSAQTQSSGGSHHNKLSAAFSKVTAKVKNSINKTSDDSDSLETMSIASGFSDDSDFINELTMQDEELAFESSQRALNDEDGDSAILSVPTADRMKRMYSVTIFNVTGIEAAMQKVQNDIVAKVVVGSIRGEEKGDVFYDEFQNKQMSDMSNYSETESMDHKPIKLRYSKGPKAANLAYRADEKGFAHIQISDYSLNLFTSSVEKLGPLTKDETESSESFPLLVEVANFDLELQSSKEIKVDDKPSEYEHAWNEKPPNESLKVRIQQVAVTRDYCGTIIVKGSAAESEASSQPHSLRSVKADKSTNTVKVRSDESPAVDPIKPNTTNGTLQVVEEMKHLREENRTLKDQILRLNERLIEKDQEEFHKEMRASDGDGANSRLQRELDFYMRETKSLRIQVMKLSEEVDSLKSTK